MDGSILVVDDDDKTRDLLALNLRNAGYQVACARDVDEAKVLANRGRPDVVLLDRMVTGHPALHYARQLRVDPRTAHVALIVLGAGSPPEQDTIAALESGADDYIVKPFSIHVLLARIKAIVRRCAPQLDEEPIEAAGLTFDPAARRVTAAEREIELCTIEYRLLHFFLTHPGRVLSRSRLLDEIWGDDVCIEERTVDLHVRRLRHALQPTGHSELIETVRGLGYRFRGAEGASSSRVPPAGERHDHASALARAA